MYGFENQTMNMWIYGKVVPFSFENGIFGLCVHNPVIFVLTHDAMMIHTFLNNIGNNLLTFVNFLVKKLALLLEQGPGH